MVNKKYLEHEGLRTWIEVDSKAVLNNYTQFRKLIPPQTKLMSVVKSNAYGHDLLPFSKLVEKFGVDEIAVDSITEALTLRKGGIKIPILVLGTTLSSLVPLAVKGDITLTISSFDSLKELFAIKKGMLKIHIKVDTGMSRQGFLLDEKTKVLKKNKVTA